MDNSYTVNAPDINKAASDEDISHPSQVDYLKARVYLYKFTPEIFFGGKQAQKDFSTDALNRSASQQILNQVISMSAVLQTIRNDLAALDFNKSALDFTADPSTSRAARSLEKFLTLPSLEKDFKLILVDSDRDPSGRTNEVLSVETTTTLGSSLYEDTKILYDSLNLQGSLTFSSRQAHKGRAQRLLAFLGNALNMLGKIKDSAETSQKDLSTQLTAVRSSVKQFQVNRFVYDLNPKDLSRFDLSRFLQGYKVDQQLGMLSPGTISGAASLQDAVIPLAELTAVPGPRAVRRPIFFPDAKGDYAGYTNGVPSTSLQNGLNGFTIDPVTNEAVSTIQQDVLVTRIAMAQTLEDNGGKEKIKNYNSAFAADVDRLELAIRLRGISDPRKKQLITDFFRTGVLSDELVRLATKKGKKKSVVKNVGALTSEEQVVKRELLTAKVGNVASQLAQLRGTLTDQSVDGILVSDLIQKYDFFSIFIYKHEVSPDLVERSLEVSSGDPYFFDKEALFLHTPASFLFDPTIREGEQISIEEFNSRKDSFFATYTPEFNGFVLSSGSSSMPGQVNTINLELMGCMGLLAATQRIYSASVFQDSVFDAAELADSRLFNLYQNIYADKDPFEILTSLLESLYLLRVSIPIKDVALSDERKKQIADEVAAKLVRTTVTADRVRQLQEQAIRQAEEREKARRTRGGAADYERDADGNVSSFLDILSLRAFNQFQETTSKGVAKGPKHIFNMASFLYANVMRGRRFNVRVPSAEDAAAVASGAAPYDIDSKGNVRGRFNPYEHKVVLRYDKEGDGSGGSVLEINPFISSASTLNANQDKNNKKVTVAPEEAKAWKAYFLFLSSSFGNFVADVKTGFEIMTDVLGSCYLELFETPGGRFIFRTPQYNNSIPLYRTYVQDGVVSAPTDQTSLTARADGTIITTSSSQEASNAAHLLTSSDIIQVSSAYHQTAKNLVSKQQVTYGVDLIGPPIEQLAYFYSNGKAISQYGLVMGAPVVNPNVRSIPREKIVATGIDITDATIANGIFHYCRFFLEYRNINNFTGSITAIGDPKIQVGRTYFDAVNQKFGYISTVSKTLQVGGEYLATFGLNAVRDAVYGEVGGSREQDARPTFRLLPEMESFIPEFTHGKTRVKNLSPEQRQKGPASDNYGVLISNPTANTFGNPYGRGIVPSPTK